MENKDKKIIEKERVRIEGVFRRIFSKSRAIQINKKNSECGYEYGGLYVNVLDIEKMCREFVDEIYKEKVVSRKPSDRCRNN